MARDQPGEVVEVKASESKTQEALEWVLERSRFVVGGHGEMGVYASLGNDASRNR